MPVQSYLIGAANEEIASVVGQDKPCSGINVALLTTINFLNGDPAFAVVKVDKNTNGDICSNINENQAL